MVMFLFIFRSLLHLNKQIYHFNRKFYISSGKIAMSRECSPELRKFRMFNDVMVTSMIYYKAKTSIQFIKVMPLPSCF